MWAAICSWIRLGGVNEISATLLLYCGSLAILFAGYVAYQLRFKKEEREKKRDALAKVFGRSFQYPTLHQLPGLQMIEKPAVPQAKRAVSQPQSLLD